MRAVVWHAAGDLRVEDVPEPGPPGPGQALVEVAFCGLCGTDLAEYRHGPVLIRTGAHPLTGAAPPMVLGHEFSGRVVALGGEVPGVQEGTRVTVDPCWRCGECPPCRRGDYHICRAGGAVGLASDGALASLVTVPIEGLVPLPDQISDEMAALTEPLAVGLHAVRKSGLGPGDTALVQGFGPVGAAVLLAARALGAAEVFVSEPAAVRRDLALRLGATEAFDPATTDAGREVYARTGRDGAAVVFECSGVAALLSPALDAARRGGTIVLVGVAGETTSIDPKRIVLFERRVLGSLGYHHDLPRVVDLIASGRIDPSPLATGVVGLDDAITGGFDALASGDPRHMKILVRPT